YKGVMQDAIDNYTIDWNGERYTGSILQLVDETNAAMMEEFREGETFHILYAAIQMSSPVDEAAQISHTKWTYYRSFYLEAKNRVKQQIADDLNCTALEEKFAQLNPATYLGADGTITPAEILNFTQGGVTYLGDISAEELAIKVRQLEEHCNSTFSDADKTRISEILETFFNNQPLNILRIIPLELTNTDLLQEINLILGPYGCNLNTSVPFVYVMSDQDDCKYCNPFIDGIDWYTVYEENCKEDLESIRQDQIEIKIKETLEAAVANYQKNYQCAANIGEAFMYRYDPKEYHYMLYYYDRAGNLVQTVPPAGVNTEGIGLHSLKTNYYYNSLGQMVRQSSPDGGTTQFRYDSKGQLRLSQNAEQLKQNEFSYTRYDRQGRIVEVGELKSTLPLDQPSTPVNADYLAKLTNLNDPDFPTAADFELVQVTKTFYDLGVDPVYKVEEDGSEVPFEQENIRGRVSHVELYEEESQLSSATYYSYD
ncbi:MAG: RHS repeat domain-containing protein, partial [Bacteroidota bacterium]